MYEYTYELILCFAFILIAFADQATERAQGLLLNRKENRSAKNWWPSLNKLSKDCEESQQRLLLGLKTFLMTGQSKIKYSIYIFTS